MWGNILTEVSYIQNFNMSFSNNKADVLIHLTQWQYWWWFWFSFLWVLYYLLVARVFRYRTLKFNPRIASTLRPHGKWGDLLTCLIPVTWCLNILINSNFILKLIEWQSESSLFTLRVRAKQWYWIYKLDLRNIADIFSAPRNIGRNKWQFATFGDLQTAEDYLHIMQMRAYNTWSKDFWSELGKKANKKNKFNITTPVENYKIEFIKNVNTTQLRNNLENGLFINNNNADISNFFFPDNVLFGNFSNYTNTFLKENKSNFEETGLINFYKTPYIFYINLDDGFDKIYKQNNLKKLYPLSEKKNSPIIDTLSLNSNIKTWNDSKVEKFSEFFRNSILNKNNFNFKQTVIHPDFDDETRIIKRNSGKNTPLRILKYPNSDFFFKTSISQLNDNNIELFRFRFNEKNPTISNKPIKPTVYLTFKQKRYNQRTSINKK